MTSAAPEEQGPPAATYPRITNLHEVLLRQVHPSQLLDDGRPDSSAFSAKPSHNYLLSTRREAVTAERAFREWCETNESVGTYGVSVGEAESQGLAAFDDSEEAGQPLGHASIDFRGRSNGQVKQAGRKLRDAAAARGRLFPI